MKNTLDKTRRNTKQRSVLLKIINESCGHLDANQIHQRAMQELPRISLATVYRNLRMLKENGLINEVHIDETHHHYEVKPEKEHYHMICILCGKVEEFEFPVEDEISRRKKELKGFEIDSIEMTITGYCKKCKDKSASRKG